MGCGALLGCGNKYSPQTVDAPESPAKAKAGKNAAALDVVAEEDPSCTGAHSSESRAEPGQITDIVESPPLASIRAELPSNALDTVENLHQRINIWHEDLTDVAPQISADPTTAITDHSHREQRSHANSQSSQEDSKVDLVVDHPLATQQSVLPDANRAHGTGYPCLPLDPHILPSAVQTEKESEHEPGVRECSLLSSVGEQHDPLFTVPCSAGDLSPVLDSRGVEAAVTEPGLCQYSDVEEAKFSGYEDVATLLKGLFSNAGAPSTDLKTTATTAFTVQVADKESTQRKAAGDRKVCADFRHSKIQFVAYELCTRPRAPYEIVEESELKTLLAAVSDSGLPTLTKKVNLSSGSIRQGGVISAWYCPRQRFWRKIQSKSQLPSKGWCAVRCGSVEDAQSYMRQDLAARLKILREALECAASLQDIDPSPDTLKVFIAPEFLLRGPPDLRSREEVLGDLKDPESLIAQLHTLIAGSRWLSWRCLFGTVLGSNANMEDATDAGETYNLAIMLNGGLQTLDEKRQGCHTFLKSHENGVDFLQRGVELEARAESMAATQKRKTDYKRGNAESLVNVMRSAMARESALDKGSKSFKALQNDDSIVVAAGAHNFGVEVCLDHSMGRLRKELKARPELGPLDVQLVTSCGMNIRHPSVAVRPGGIVLHCDGLHGEGYASHSSAFIWGERGPRLKIPVRASFPAHGHDWKCQMSPDDLGTLYCTSFPDDVTGPMIRVYEAVPLPSPASEA